MNTFRNIVIGLAILWALPSEAAVATFYIEAAGCTNGNTRCSGTSDSASELVSGAAATITCSATTGPSATPGCSFTGTPNLSLITGCVAGVCDGSQFLYIDCATNANQKVFPIITIDDTLDLIGTTGTPTGCTAATSDWGVGGRRLWPTGATAEAVIQGGLRGGDTVQFGCGGDPGSKSVAFITPRTSGDNTNGSINFIGKSGCRPVLTVTNTASIIATSSLNFWTISNLELVQQGASGDCIAAQSGYGWLINNVKITSCGAVGINSTGYIAIQNTEVTGTLSNAVIYGVMSMSGSYIHNNTGNAVTSVSTAPVAAITNTVISNNAGRGIYWTGSTSIQNLLYLSGVTVYGSGNSGMEITNAGAFIRIENSIFEENGNAAGEYNIEWLAGTAQLHGSHNNNVFFHSNCQGSNTGGPACVSGLTANSTEVTSSALFTNAGGGNFTLQSGSPAKATGYPGAILGGGTGYLDMGALQRQESSGSHIIGGGF